MGIGEDSGKRLRCRHEGRMTSPQMQAEGGKQALPEMIGGKIGGTIRFTRRNTQHFQYTSGIKWWRGGDSNPRPRDYESRALTS